MTTFASAKCPPPLKGGWGRRRLYSADGCVQILSYEQMESSQIRRRLPELLGIISVDYIKKCWFADIRSADYRNYWFTHIPLLFFSNA